jgi:hypothetical protein
LFRQRKLLVFVLGTLVLVAFAYALYRERHAVGQMSRLGLRQLGVMSVTMVLGVLVTGCTTRLYLMALGVRISVWEAFWLSAVMFLCSYLPLQLNLLMRAKYLRQLHSLPYAAYTAMVLTNLGVMFCAIGIYGALSLVLLWWQAVPPSLAFAGLFALCAVLPPLLAAAAWRLGPNRLARGKISADILSAGHKIWRRRDSLVLAVGLTVVALFLWSVRFHAAAQHVMPGQRLELAMILPPVATLSTYLAITPSGLGIRELASSGLTEMIGMDHAVGLAVTTIERAVSLVCFVVLGLIGALVLGRRFHQQPGPSPTNRDLLQDHEISERGSRSAEKTPP